MRQLGKVILLILLIVFVIYACEKPKTYSNVPVVSFKSLEIKNGADTLGNEIKSIVLTTYIEDGDGNVGLYAIADTSREYDVLEEFNYFIELYEKIDGEFVKVNFQEHQYFRIPYIEQQGQKKLLKAEVEVSFEYTLKFFTYDTIKYEFHIYDRDLNKSNIAETPEIPTDSTGVITK
jgi:hypothetical protein